MPYASQTVQQSVVGTRLICGRQLLIAGQTFIVPPSHASFSFPKLIDALVKDIASCKRSSCMGQKITIREMLPLLWLCLSDRVFQANLSDDCGLDL